MTPLILECSFYIPINRDANFSDGLPHKIDLWDLIDNELFRRFEGGTVDPNRYRGFYKDPDTGERVNDESYRFIVAIPKEKLDELRLMLREACGWFEQKCIYLSIAGEVEFIGREKHEAD